MRVCVLLQLMFLMDSIEKNFADADINKDGMLDIDEFHKLLEKADAKIRALPATAQVRQAAVTTTTSWRRWGAWHVLRD